MKNYLNISVAVLCCALMSITFTACGGDEEVVDVPVTKAVKWNYKITVEPATGADDYPDIVETLVTVPNNGTLKDNEITYEKKNANLDIYEYSSYNSAIPFTTFPDTKTITINEKLLEDADLTSKSSYKVGLHYKLEVTSMDTDDSLIDYQVMDVDAGGSVQASKLSMLYPQTTTLTISVDKSGKISIK